MADAYVYSWDGSDWKGWFPTRQDALEYVRRYFSPEKVFTGKVIERVPPESLREVVSEMDFQHNWNLRKDQQNDLEQALLGTIQYCLGSFTVSSVTPEDVLQH